MKKPRAPRRTARLLEGAAAIRAPGSMSSAAGMRAALAAAQGRSPGARRERAARRRFLPVPNRVAMAVVAVAAGVGVGLAVTATRTTPRAAPRPLVVQQGVQLAVSPSSGGCGTRFLFSASGRVAGQGTLVFQWERSDGVVGPRRSLSITAGQAKFLVTNDWILSSPASAAITMTLRVLAPTTMSVSHSITPACK